MNVNPPKENFLKLIEAFSSKINYVRGDLTQIEKILSAISGLLWRQGEITEDDFCVPKLIYGLMKDLNERMANVYSEQYGLKTLCFRPCYVFGTGREAAKVGRLFNDLISDPALGNSFQTEFAPWPYLWTYVDDVTRFIRVLLDTPSPKYRIYNMGGWTVTSAEVGEIVKRYIPDAKITFGKENVDLGTPRKIINARAREDLGFNLTPLKDSVLLHINEARAEAGLSPIKA